MKHFCLILLLFILTATWISAITLEDGDTVAFLGNTVIERAQNYGHFETTLSLAAGQKHLTFRNLGWSGDTVFGTARSYFGPPEEGFERLKDDLSELKPQVIIICYGAVAAFGGETKLTEFTTGYEKLIAMAQSAASPREIILVSPPPTETLPAPMPDLNKHNSELARYSQAIAALAKKHQLEFADFFTTLGSSSKLTDNGLHFHEAGYAVAARSFVKSLGLTVPSETHLTSPPVQKLREAIIAKNKLFFLRWRPANETYLRLFRKHEQGQNAKELLLFDPLIADAEKGIETLKDNALLSQ